IPGMPGGNSEARGMVVNSSGSIIVAGYTERGSGDYAFFTLRYNAMPAVRYVSPETVDLGYEGDMEIEGDDFYPGAALLLSGTGITVSSYTVESSSMVRAYVAVAWDAPLGPRDVSVMNVDGAMHAMPGAFSVAKGSPTVAYVSPETVDRGYAVDLGVEGNNFDPGASLLLSGTGITISSYAVVSSTMMSAYITVAWDAPLGPRDVSVINLDGLMDTTTGAFTVEKGSPVVSYVWPESVEQGTSEDLEISGNNFDPGAALFLSGTGITISSYAVISSTLVTAYVFIDMAAPLGLRDVSVRNTDGLADTMAAAVTVIKHFPVVSYVWPETGERGAVLDLEISGDYFEPGASFVMSGAGITISSYAVVSSTMMSAHIVVAWDAPLGPRDASVFNVDGGSDTMAAAFTLQGGLTIDLAYDTTVYYWVNGREIKMEILADTFDDMVTLLISSAVPDAAGQGRLKPSRFCVDIGNNLNLPPLRAFTMTITYQDSDIAGLDESRLAIALYDGSPGMWFALPSTVFAAQNKIVARVTHLSRFAIMQLVPAETLEGIKVFPNPFNPGKGGLVLDNLTAAPAGIHIFTVAGERVRSVEYSDGSGRVVWDGKNDGGNTVGSGVYIVLIKSSGTTRIVKVAVER
ncbi:MAG: T9SS type A sorting domain-containing protein, partial [Endomicrobiales bacterium]